MGKSFQAKSPLFPKCNMFSCTLQYDTALKHLQETYEKVLSSWGKKSFRSARLSTLKLLRETSRHKTMPKHSQDFLTMFFSILKTSG